MHCKIKWKLCSSFSFQYFIKFTRLIIESRHRRNNNALCSPLSRSGDNVSCPMRFAAESINRLRRNVWGARETTGLLAGYIWRWWSGNETSCAHGAAYTGAFNRLLLPRRCARLLLAVHLLGRRVLVGTWTGSVHPSARRRCDGRWECFLKPANCYRFIDTNIHVYKTRARKKGGSWRMIRLSQAPVLGKPNAKVWISDYGNSSSVLYHLCCIAWYMHVHQNSCDEVEGESGRINHSEIKQDWFIFILYII